MDKRPFSSIPKLFPQNYNPFKRPSVPTESLKNLFDSDYCSYSTLNTHFFTQASKSPHKNNLKDSNLRNLKLKLLNFLKLKQKPEYFSESPHEKKGKHNGIVSLSTRIISGNAKNIGDNYNCEKNCDNNEYLLGKKTREATKSVRKRKNIENLKLESTNASSNFTNSKENQGKNVKGLTDPKEEIYQFFAKKNKEEEDKGKKLYKSVNVSEGKSEKNAVKKIGKQSKDVRTELNMRELMGRIKNMLDFHVKKETIYKKKIALLEKKVKELQDQNSKCHPPTCP